MKIGYFTSKFPYSAKVPNYMCGGSILATQSLVDKISKMGDDIKVFTTSNTSKSQVEYRENVEIYRYGTQFKLMSSNISFDLFKKPIEHDVDLVHISFDVPPGPFAGYRYAKKKNVPLIITYHGDWISNYGGLTRRIGIYINKLFVKKLLSTADIIISPSEKYINQSEVLKNFHDKIRIVPNGIKIESFEHTCSKESCREKLKLSLNSNIILFVGYLVDHKGPEILLRSFRSILDILPDTILIFVGDGALKFELEQLSKKLHIEKNVQFVGFIDQNTIITYYNAADVFVLPSLSDCFPMVILEAMASGLPIIASDIGGISELVINNENGLLVQPNHSGLLADSIIYLLDNDDIRNKFGKRGRKLADNYSWKKIAETTQSIYEELL